MAEVVTIEQSAIPSALDCAWSTFTKASQRYSSLKYRKAQVGVLLNRCQELILYAVNNLRDNNRIPQDIAPGIRALENACYSVESLVDTISEKGFLWGLVHAEKIDSKVKESGSKMDSAFRILHSTAGERQDVVQLQHEMARAAADDFKDLAGRLDRLSGNDNRILAALQDQEGVYRRLQELLVAVMKHVQDLPTKDDLRPEDVFLQQAAKTLCRLTKTRENNRIASFVLSSLEVDFNICFPVGAGSSGQVYRGDWNGAVVAVKRMHVEDARVISEAQRKAIRHEVKIWSTLQHPNVLTFYGACLEATVPFLVMRYCPFGDISHYLDKYPDADRNRLSYEVAVGLAFLHSKKIVHADVKGANVLVSEDHHALLTDFGLALKIKEIRTKSTFSQNLDRQRGTLLWMAPEVLKGASPDMAADVYSLGMTIWEIFSGETPFQAFINEQVLVDNVVSYHTRPKRPSPMTDDHIWTTVQQCWAADARSRPSARQVQDGLRPLSDDAVEEELPNDFSDVFDMDASPDNIKNHASSSLEYTAPWAPGHISQNMPRTISSYAPSMPSITTSMAGVQAADPESELWSSITRTFLPMWIHVEWYSGNPSMYVNGVILPVVPPHKKCTYHVFKGDTDLGVRTTYDLNADKSQKINFLEYNKGYGINEETHIRVFAIDPLTHRDTLVAEWDPRSKPLDHTETEWSETVRGGAVLWDLDQSYTLVESVTLTRVPASTLYRFRVLSGATDLGVRSYAATAATDNTDRDVHSDTAVSVTINFPDYTGHEGLPAEEPVRIYVLEKEGSKETLVAGRMGSTTTSS
ncbi:hypothetical protein NM688_g1529 [Phlebia brevispora]|uniref:Uncharacterized protein n=1 Tax=Phlebia brevispora TaxID=194682 RepID=A0ACC1TAV3_9APHY|nr:hypothetical protein NM688_g1529 [Phlebia brevispora]